MKLLIVIPALNEEDSIEDIIRRTFAAREHIQANSPVTEVAITVVSDGSTDRTVERASAFRDSIHLIVFPKNRGYGAAIKTGWLESGGTPRNRPHQRALVPLCGDDILLFDGNCSFRDPRDRLRARPDRGTPPLLDHGGAAAVNVGPSVSRTWMEQILWCDRKLRSWLIRGAATGRNSRLPMLWAFVAIVVFRILMMSAIGPPVPAIHDEFSYLLAADTYASSRLANPPHPLWQAFESIHILSQPTYASKYQPAQGLFLALGQVVFGNPYWGVILMTALMGAALVWMLFAWLPRSWAILGGAICVASLLGNEWARSYWGGALAGLAGALLLGAYRHITFYRRYGYSWLMGLSLVLLFWTRPFEGGLLAATVCAALLVWAIRSDGPPIRRVFIPIAVLVVAGAAFQCYYDFRVTGDWKTMPYLEYSRQYQMAPLFWVAHPTPPKTYRSATLQEQHAVWEMQEYRGLLEHWRMGWLERLRLLARPYPAMGFLLAALVGLFMGDRTQCFLSAAFFGVMVPASLEVWVMRHYFAPVFGLTVLIACRLAWRVRRKARPVGSIVAAAIVIACLSPGLYWSVRGVGSEVKHHLQDQAEFPFVRSAMNARLVSEGGLNLILVRYKPSHFVAEEWVYNRADIDRSPVVWAREGGVDTSKLLDYYRNRKVWFLEADVRPWELKPWESTTH